jgi:hypothetical protein
MLADTIYLSRRVMKSPRRLTVWIVLLCIPLLSGCQVLSEYYISNHTYEDLTVRLTPLEMDQVHLASGPLIEEIQKSVRSSLQQPVSFDQEGEAIQFTLPAKTTVYLGFSGGGEDLFSQLEIRSGDRRLVMDGDDSAEHFTVHDNLVGAIVHVLDVE